MHDLLAPEPILAEAFPRTRQGRTKCRAPQTAPRCFFGPVHYEPGYAYPLVVWLHGAGEDERQLGRIMPQVSLRNYVAVAPRGWTQSPARGQRAIAWPDGRGADAAAETRVYESIAAAMARYHIGRDRVYLAGQGRGGTAALRIAVANPRRFAGAASLGGPLPRDATLFHNLDEARELPLFFGVAEDDAAAAADWDADLRLLHAAGLQATVFRYLLCEESDDGPSPAMLADLNRWMMRIVNNT